MTLEAGFQEAVAFPCNLHHIDMWINETDSDYISSINIMILSFKQVKGASTLSVGRQEGHLAW